MPSENHYCNMLGGDFINYWKWKCSHCTLSADFIVGEVKPLFTDPKIVLAENFVINDIVEDVKTYISNFLHPHQPLPPTRRCVYQNFRKIFTN